MQAPALQIWPLTHVAQNAPLRPQFVAVSAVTGMQVLPAQQPLQVAGPHCPPLPPPAPPPPPCPPAVPPLQWKLALHVLDVFVQSTQALPETPHVVLLPLFGECTQEPKLSQQPAQFDGPQEVLPPPPPFATPPPLPIDPPPLPKVPPPCPLPPPLPLLVMHAPPPQTWPTAHATQARPAAPQMSVVLPGSHRPVELQHPAQLTVEHAGFAGPQATSATAKEATTSSDRQRDPFMAGVQTTGHRLGSTPGPADEAPPTRYSQLCVVGLQVRYV
jgi:hypothetical protein